MLLPICTGFSRLFRLEFVCRFWNLFFTVEGFDRPGDDPLCLAVYDLHYCVRVLKRAGVGAAALQRLVERLEILIPRQRELAPYPLMRCNRAAFLRLGNKFLDGFALIAGVTQFWLQF